MPYAALDLRSRHWLPSGVVALVGIGVSVLLGRHLAESAVEVEKARFAQAANALTDALSRRVEAYTEIAVGLRGLFVVNPALGRRDFIDAVKSLDTGHRHPEIMNIAFTRYVLAADKPLFEQRVRADTTMETGGYPGFAIHPPGVRAEYFVAHYLWPMEGNAGIHGLDISAQPANLASMRYSMRSGNPVASAPFDLLQVPTQRTGFLIRVPVFSGPQHVVPGQPAESNFLGSVAVTLRAADLLRHLEQEGRLQGLHLVLSDRGSTLTQPTETKTLPLLSTLPAGAAAPAQLARDLHVYSRLWHLDFYPAVPFLSDSERRAPLWIAVGGSLIALLLAALVMVLVRTRQTALASADETREALQDSEGRWKFAIEGSGDALWDWSVTDGAMYYSARWKELLGFAEHEIANRFGEWSRRLHPDDEMQVTEAMQSHLAGDTPVYVAEYRIGCKDGNWKWVLDRGKVVRRDSSGAPLRMIGTLSDITGRKLTAQVLQSSLRDKEALLKEVHHRVKNNLQVITSLMRLESRRTVRAETRATLADMQGRIASMALLHEFLYRSGTFAAIDLGDYLRQVAAEAFSSQIAPTASVRLTSSLASLQLGLDQALPCGLLVNELISNSLKHAFPDGRAGEVSVELQPALTGPLWRLQVSDTGAGLPADFAIDRQSSMGLQLVSQLCHQIGGTLEVQSRPGQGAVFSVSFEVDVPAALVMPA